MPEIKPHHAENQKERERLQALAARLNDTELNLRLPNGWTVAEAFVHLAFWDLRQLEVLKLWMAKGVHPVPVDSRTVNNAVNVLAKAIPSRTAVSLALKAAEAIDGEVEKVSPALEAEILQQGHERLLNRALHRREHLEKIERTLKTQP